MLTSEPGHSGGPVTLDQLIALNDEILALVRSGIPLERGLVLTGRDLQGRLGAIARDLGGRMEQGDRLPEALAKSGYVMPDLYRAIVEAGLRSGRLASALEGMAAVARGYSEARQAVGLALLYPLMVVSLAYGLALGFVVLVAPRFVAAFGSMGLRPMGLLEALARVGETAVYWGPVFPTLLALLVLRWVWSGRSAALDHGPFGRWSSRIPVLGRMMAGFRSANFADILALLIEHGVPLEEAVGLAADAAGGRVRRSPAVADSDEVRGGGPSQGAQLDPDGSLPPLLAWMVRSGRRQGDLPQALRHAAATYRSKSRARAEAIRIVLPTALMLTIGAWAVLLYGLLLFVPLTKLYDELALPT